MKLTLQIELNIELIEAGDPVPGDPLEDRMQDSAEEAIRNQLEAGEANGFSHDLESISAITIEKIQRIPTPL